jgi:hypothetical protein
MPRREARGSSKKPESYHQSLVGGTKMPEYPTACRANGTAGVSPRMRRLPRRTRNDKSGAILSGYKRLSTGIKPWLAFRPVFLTSLSNTLRGRANSPRATSALAAVAQRTLRVGYHTGSSRIRDRFLQ